MKKHRSEPMIATCPTALSDPSDRSDAPDCLTSRAFRLGSLLGLCLALAPMVLRAQIPTPNPPERLTYQGYLVDANGSALGDPNPKNYDVIFRIWNDQNSTDTSHRLWSEQQTITVDKGYFSVLLGEGSQFSSEPYPPLSTLFDGADASERYIEVTVKGIGSGGSDVTILPRLRLLTSPYAFLAQKALNATKLVNNTNGAIVSVDGSALTVNGSVAANTFTGNGAGLTSLNGANLSDGSITPAKLASNIGIWTALGGGQIFHAGDVKISSGNLVMDNTAIISAYNSSGQPEQFLYPRWSDNATYLDFGDGGFHIRNNHYAEVMYMNSSGGVGIGTTAPAARFQVVGGAIMPAVGNSASAGIEFPNNPGGGSGDEAYIRYYPRSGESCTLELGIQNDGDDNIALMPSGHVGINTLNPTHGTLEVHATTTISLNNYDYLAGPSYLAFPGVYTYNSSVINGNSGNFLCAFYSDNGRVVAPEVDAFSDARLKHIEGVSNGQKDLRTLMGIQITDYQMVDNVADGTRQYKKVIAQQVEKVYPQAVSRTSGTVPDIYQRTEAKAGWIHLSKRLSPALKAGDEVKILTQKTSALHKVLEVNAEGFRVKEPLNGVVFVYGREVNDLRTVDYDAIAMLNVSATQELCRQLQAKDAEIRQLREEVEALAAHERVQAARFDELEARIDRMRPPVERVSLH